MLLDRKKASDNVRQSVLRTPPDLRYRTMFHMPLQNRLFPRRKGIKSAVFVRFFGIV
jgi:hypothetical protein